MTKDDRQLIDAAKAVCGDFTLRDSFEAGGVGAAIRTVSGNVYTGICIDLGSGLGFCAEVAAIAEMLKARETQIDTVVAVSGRQILPPCGCCREAMVQTDARNLDTRVIIDDNTVVALRDLIPSHWMDER